MKPLLTTVAIIGSCAFVHADPFDDWDKNKDGRLSREEVPEPLRRVFDAVDTNHDGFSSREEDRVARERNNARSQQGPRLPIISTS